MKSLIFRSLLALCAIPLMASAADPQTLRFGIDPTYPPFESKRPDGSFVGFDVDLGNAICANLHVRCIWVEQSFDAMIPALKARKFDAILSAMTATPARRQQIDFSDRLYSGAPRLIARAGSRLQPTAESLKGRRIGVQQGSVQESYAMAEWASKGVQVIAYPGTDQLYQDLATGRLDASFQTAIQADIGFLRTPRGKAFAFAGAEIDDRRASGDGVAIGIRKDDKALADRINRAIAAIRKNGEYDTLARKYFSFDIYGN